MNWMNLKMGDFKQKSIIFAAQINKEAPMKRA